VSRKPDGLPRDGPLPTDLATFAKELAAEFFERMKVFGKKFGGCVYPLVADKSASGGRQAPDSSSKSNTPYTVPEFTGGEVLR